MGVKTETLVPPKLPRVHMIPFDLRENNSNPTNGATMFPMDVSTGTKPGTVKSLLWVRFGFVEGPKDFERLVIPYMETDSTAMPAGAAALKAKFCVVRRNAWRESSSTYNGLPNGEILAHTGSAITWGAAQDAYNSNATNQQGCGFEFSGGLWRPAEPIPVAVFGIAQVGYANIGTPDLCGQTPTTTTTTPTASTWKLSYDTSALPNHRGSRLGSQLYGRSMLYINDLISTSIDSFDWSSSTLNGSISVINWSAYTSGQIQGTADWAVITEGPLTGGSSISLTSGTNIRSSIQSASIFFEQDAA